MTTLAILDLPLETGLLASVRSSSAVTLALDASAVSGLYEGHALTIDGEVR